ncbi:hypothetical protein FF38_07318 [Lucilia cuprina]|uniref:Uncharacterized protein n=1 Tax=Lucilia cuprina TaxID=7375 RepID=A0A0L0BQH7_LUCCU|nr:hypothetical protein FF38_07318 [Lucilia cuprina]
MGIPLAMAKRNLNVLNALSITKISLSAGYLATFQNPLLFLIKSWNSSGSTMVMDIKVVVVVDDVEFVLFVDDSCECFKGKQYVSIKFSCFSVLQLTVLLKRFRSIFCATTEGVGSAFLLRSLDVIFVILPFAEGCVEILSKSSTVSGLCLVALLTTASLLVEGFSSCLDLARVMRLAGISFADLPLRSVISLSLSRAACLSSRLTCEDLDCAAFAWFLSCSLPKEILNL